MDFEAEIRRHVTLLEEDANGEKAVSRHILRKVNELQDGLSKVEKDVSALREEFVLLRADLPGIIANVVGALLREERERK
jgi:hypothetical protein